jgi:hypothetical protein
MQGIKILDILSVNVEKTMTEAIFDHVLQVAVELLCQILSDIMFIF